mmetsp:Transcript_11257/g.25545  ORF Transcript_11257/g.25545 Transcript_11257/m.25545 type:complete len:274 (-) Transcript_11257:1-822(-)
MATKSCPPPPAPQLPTPAGSELFSWTTLALRSAPGASASSTVLFLLSLYRTGTCLESKMTDIEFFPDSFCTCCILSSGSMLLGTLLVSSAGRCRSSAFFCGDDEKWRFDFSVLDLCLDKLTSSRASSFCTNSFHSSGVLLRSASTLCDRRSSLSSPFPGLTEGSEASGAILSFLLLGPRARGVNPRGRRISLSSLQSRSCLLFSSSPSSPFLFQPYPSVSVTTRAAGPGCWKELLLPRRGKSARRMSIFAALLSQPHAELLERRYILTRAGRS